MVVGIGWTAGVVRARLLMSRRIGRAQCRRLAALGSFDEALQALRTGPYSHDVRDVNGLQEAQWQVAATPLWHLRILAGWLPPTGGEQLRVLAGWWEVLNIENLLAGLAGAPAQPAYELGRLETAWRRVRGADTPAQVRAELARSAWLDPGAEDPATIVTWLRLSWAHRAAREDGMLRLASGWAALVAAGDLLLGEATRHKQSGGHDVPELGVDWSDTTDLNGFTAHLPRDAAWGLESVAEPRALWRAEVRWWQAMDARGREQLRHADSGAAAVAGAFAALLADAHSVQAALELAARGADEDVIHALI